MTLNKIRKVNSRMNQSATRKEKNDEAESIFDQLNELAERGNPVEMFQLGRILCSGNDDEARRIGLEWIHKSGNTEYPPALCWLGHYYLRIKKENDAVEWFRKAAVVDEPSAQNQLGRMYLDGIGVAVDKRRAAELFQAAASNGEVNGMVNLAAALLVGSGVPRDFDRAVGLLQEAASIGDKDAIKLISALDHKTPSSSPDQVLRDWARTQRGESIDTSSQNQISDQDDEAEILASHAAAKRQQQSSILRTATNPPPPPPAQDHAAACSPLKNAQKIQQQPQSLRPSSRHLPWRMNQATLPVLGTPAPASPLKKSISDELDEVDDIADDDNFSPDKLERAAVGVRTAADVPDSIIPPEKAMVGVGMDRLMEEDFETQSLPSNENTESKKNDSDQASTANKDIYAFHLSRDIHPGNGHTSNDKTHMKGDLHDMNDFQRRFQDPEKIRQDAQNGNRIAQFWLARLLFGQVDNDTNISRNEAKHDDNINGYFVDPRSIEAIQWLHRSADAGHVSAARELGILYQEGKVPVNYKERVAGMNEATAKVESSGASILGNAAHQENGMKARDKAVWTRGNRGKDQDRAIHYFEVGSADSGSLEDDRLIWCRLGELLIHRAIILNDAATGKRGIHWTEKAARAGVERAAVTMARVYMAGTDNSQPIPGSTLDLVKATEWSKKVPGAHELTERATRLLLYSNATNNRQHTAGGSDDFKKKSSIPSEAPPPITAAAKRRKRRKAKQQHQQQVSQEEENEVSSASVFGGAVTEAPSAQPGETVADIFRRHKGVELVQIEDEDHSMDRLDVAVAAASASNTTAPRKNNSRTVWRSHRQREETNAAKTAAAANAKRALQARQRAQIGSSLSKENADDNPEAKAAAARAAERELLREEAASALVNSRKANQQNGRRDKKVAVVTAIPEDDFDDDSDESDDDDGLLSLASAVLSARKPGLVSAPLSSGSGKFSESGDDQTSVLLSSPTPPRDAVPGEEHFLDDDDNGEWQLTARQRRKARRHAKEEETTMPAETSKDEKEESTTENSVALVAAETMAEADEVPTVIETTIKSDEENDAVVTISSPEEEDPDDDTMMDSAPSNDIETELPVALGNKDDVTCAVNKEKEMSTEVGIEALETSHLESSEAGSKEEELRVTEPAIVRRDWADDDDDEVPIILPPQPPSREEDDDRHIPSLAIPEYEDEDIYDGAVEESKAEPPSCPVDPDDFVDEDYGPVPETKEEPPETYGIDYSFEDEDFIGATPEAKSSYPFDDGYDSEAAAALREAEDDALAHELSRRMIAEETQYVDNRDWIPATNKRGRRGKKAKALAS